MNAGLGYGGILLAIVAAAVLALRAGPRRGQGGPLQARLRPAMVALAGATGASFLALEVALAGDAFSVRYVAEHSSRATPMLSKLTAAWAGPSGRLLLGSLLLAVAMSMLLRRVTEDDRLGATSLGVLGAVELGILGLLATVANPFYPLTPVPADGSGPSPAGSALGAVHPFLLTAGCAALAVTLAMAVGARLSGQGRPDWAGRARSWASAAWGLVTLGVLGQAWWSSSLIGWGGPWDAGARRSPLPLLWALATGALVAALARGEVRQWPRAAWAAAALGVAVVCLPAVALAARPTGAARARSATLTEGRDLSTVSISEMEQVISANPTIVGMRLALSERYLRASRPQDANEQASIALALDPPAAQRQEALKLLGWSAAILGRAQEGAALLEQSLALDATDRDATWFLANVRLVGLGDPEGAITLLEQLLAGTMTADQRRTAEERLFEAKIRTVGPVGPALSLEPAARP